MSKFFQRNSCIKCFECECEHNSTAHMFVASIKSSTKDRMKNKMHARLLSSCPLQLLILNNTRGFEGTAFVCVHMSVLVCVCLVGYVYYVYLCIILLHISTKSVLRSYKTQTLLSESHLISVNIVQRTSELRTSSSLSSPH